MSNESPIITIEMKKPVYGGYTLGFHDGKVILVPGALPGETLRVRIVSVRKDYSTGIIEAIIAGSEHRVVPECVKFGRCGGCSYLNTSYEYELEIKKTVLMDALTRIGGLEPATIPDIEIIGGERHNYRSHATVRVRDGCAGFFREGSNDLVPFPEGGCLLLAHKINEFLCRGLENQGEVKIAVDAEGTIVNSLKGESLVTENVSGFVYQRSIGQFFQANLQLRKKMLHRVKLLAELTETDTFMDIGCGVGFFSLYMAGSAAHGTGFDSNRSSIAMARKNARINKIGNLDFAALAASRIHPARSKPRVVVIDPPRAGIDRKARGTIAALAPVRLLYVSCNPATFSRDVKDFIKAGYSLDSLTLIDMFPCTHHIEVISRFSRDAS